MSYLVPGQFSVHRQVAICPDPVLLATPVLACILAWHSASKCFYSSMVPGLAKPKSGSVVCCVVDSVVKTDRTAFQCRAR